MQCVPDVEDKFPTLWLFIVIDACVNILLSESAITTYNSLVVLPFTLITRLSGTFLHFLKYMTPPYNSQSSISGFSQLTVLGVALVQ